MYHFLLTIVISIIKIDHYVHQQQSVWKPVVSWSTAPVLFLAGFTFGPSCQPSSFLKKFEIQNWNLNSCDSINCTHEQQFNVQLQTFKKFKFIQFLHQQLRFLWQQFLICTKSLYPGIMNDTGVHLACKVQLCLFKNQVSAFGPTSILFRLPPLHHQRTKRSPHHPYLVAGAAGLPHPCSSYSFPVLFDLFNACCTLYWVVSLLISI